MADRVKASFADPKSIVGPMRYDNYNVLLSSKSDIHL